MKGGRGRVGGPGKQEPLSLRRDRVCVCVRVCDVFMCESCECPLCFLPSKTRRGQTAKWCGDG